MTPLWVIVLSCMSQVNKNQKMVKRIRFEGNGAFWSGTSDYSLRAAMVQKQNEPFAFLAPKH